MLLKLMTKTYMYIGQWRMYNKLITYVFPRLIINLLATCTYTVLKMSKVKYADVICLY